VIDRVLCSGAQFVRIAAALLAGALIALGGAAQAQPAQDAGPPWSALTPAQKTALAPLERDWPQIDAVRKQKWLEIAARLPGMPSEERQRIQQRMTEWSRMTPDERGRARLQFQEARQISPQERQARWDAYLALPAEERRALAVSTTTVPKVKPKAAAAVPAQKNTGAGTPEASPPPKPVAPTLVQAKPGASTTLISKTATPPAHAQAGKPKIAAGTGAVDRSTLLPQPDAQRGAAASAPK
jgi:Protein of unknown function (DUF3106)